MTTTPPDEPQYDEAMQNAIKAGWNPDDGPPPYEHAAPPPIDPELGNNGIPPTDAPRVS